MKDNQDFSINKENLIKKIQENKFNRLVIIGKNGVGKTQFLKEIVNNSNFKTYFIEADLDMTKEIKNNKNTNFNKINSLLNELTNFSFEIDEEKLLFCLKQEKEFNDYVLDSNKKINLVENWMNKNTESNKLIFNKNDEDLLDVEIKKPEIVKFEKFDINFNKKISMNNFFQKISEEGGSGQQFYTLLKLVEKVLQFSSNLNNRYYLIIDEPENLCHPELIIKIAKTLKEISKSLKVICVSHSSIFVNNFIDSLEEIVLIDKSKKYLNFNQIIFLETIKEINTKFLEITIKFPKINHNKSLKYLIDVYSIDNFNWFKNWSIKNELITSLFYKKIIICEGLNDEYFLNTLNLDTSIFILKSFGKFEFPYIKNFLNYFNKKVFTVYDDDVEYEKTQKSTKNEFWKEINNVLEKCSKFTNNIDSYIFKKNLETELELKLAENNKLKYYIPRMDVINIVNNKKIKNIQKILLARIENFYNN